MRSKEEILKEHFDSHGENYQVVELLADIRDELVKLNRLKERYSKGK